MHIIKEAGSKGPFVVVLARLKITLFIQPHSKKVDNPFTFGSSTFTNACRGLLSCILDADTFEFSYDIGDVRVVNDTVEILGTLSNGKEWN